ncbi:MAG: hypothetical protein JO246_16320 [Frankiaceae bacterium]|nr:hypothetical protein [Frankiaceae bacterium]MBV9871771.1 hypothetical protein [Frankiaceae bacterium]
METQSAHPRVRTYLAQLDEALVRLPDHEAAELRAQIREHLDEAITAEASDLDAARILDRLGTPDALVDDALGAPTRRRRLSLRRFRQVRRRVWIVTAVVLTLFGSGLGYVVDMATQPSLQNPGGSYGFLARIDGKHVNSIDNVTGRELETAVRPGHRQGFVVVIYNPSNWPETVIGTTDSGLKARVDTPAQVGVSPVNPNFQPEPTTTSAYTLPATIAPHQYRYVLLSWRSERCWGDKGEVRGTSALSLRVKIGWFTHTQHIPLDNAFAMRGTRRSGRLATSKSCALGPR